MGIFDFLKGKKSNPEPKPEPKPEPIEKPKEYQSFEYPIKGRQKTLVKIVEYEEDHDYERDVSIEPYGEGKTAVCVRLYTLNKDWEMKNIRDYTLGDLTDEQSDEIEEHQHNENMKLVGLTYDIEKTLDNEGEPFYQATLKMKYEILA